MVLVGAFLACAHVEPSGAQSRTNTATDQIERLHDYLGRATAFGFSGAVLVASGDEILLSEGYGWADPKRNLPVTPQTMFDIGSLSKQFTAAAVLKLADDGLLDVDDPIADFFDSVPADKRDITLHELLTHTSGLPRESGADFEDLTADQFIRAVLDQPLVHAPGAQFSYSNTGYALLAQVVARRAGRAFTEFVREELFEPAGLSRTGFVGEARWDPVDVARAAGGELDGESPLDWSLEPAMQGQGSVLTTVEDLHTWIGALHRGDVLSAGSLKLLFTPQVDNYAYGWAVRQTDRGRRVAHTGIWYAFSSSFRRYLDEDLTTATLARYVGDYEVDAATQVSVSQRDGALSLTTESQAGFDLLVPTPAEATDVRSTKEFNRRIADVWNGIRNERFDAVAKLVSPGRRDVYVDLLRRYWHERADSLGSYRAHRVQGTLAPYGAGDEHWTYVRTEFERGADTAYFWWWGDGLVHGFVHGASLPEMATRFHPVSSTEFVSFNLWSEVRRRIRFRAGPGGRGAAIEFEMPGGRSRVAMRRP